MTGLPRPSITWIKDDQPLQLSERVNKLNSNKTIKIKGVRLDDRGSYTCIAQNPLGKVNLTLELSVRHNASLTTSETPSATPVPTTKVKAKGKHLYQSYFSVALFIMVLPFNLFMKP